MPDRNQSKSFSLETAAMREVSVIEEALKALAISFRTIAEEKTVLFSYIMDIGNQRIGLNCASQIQINSASHHPEFLVTDVLLDVKVDAPEIESAICVFCNNVNNSSAVVGGHMVFSQEMDSRFKYKNAILLPDGRLTPDMMRRLFNYMSIFIGGFFRTLQNWISESGFVLEKKTDTFYVISIMGGSVSSST
ncbi:MAG: hypothetical protein V2B19_16390 [Pseudomonadota bacterium]